MKFKYQARNKEGEMQVGVVEAQDRDQAAQILVSHELFVLSIEDAEKQGAKQRLLSAFNRVKVKDLMVFTRQFSTLIESEVPLNSALKSLADQTKNPVLKEAIVRIQQDVESGLSLSQALEAQKPIFSDFYVNMIRSAEVTGRLEEAMHFLAQYMEREVVWRGRILNALIYPAVLLTMFFAVIIIMVVFVFPKIKPVFEESGTSLPLITRIVLGFGDFVLAWWWLIIIVCVGLVFILADYFSTKEGKTVWAQIILSVPVFGTLFQKMYISRFAESLSILIKGGIPVAQAMEIAGDTIGNVVYRELLQNMADGVRGGALLSNLLTQAEKYFPAIVSQMTAIGETTGRLDEMMAKIGTFFDREVNDMMANLSEIIQPILILFIGVFIGILFASILLPIYDLAQTFKM